MPASPLEVGLVRSKWPVYAGIAGVLTAVGIVGGIFAFGSDSKAKPEGATTATAAPTETPKPSAEATQPAAPAKKQVVLAIEPIDAEVFAGSEKLGQSPVVLELGEGEKKTVEIKRDGFKPKTLTVDTSEPKLSVKLARIPGARYVPPIKKPDTPKPAGGKTGGGKTGGGDPAIVDPWK
jgi:hypothetical protein